MNSNTLIRKRIGPMTFSFDLAFCENSGILKTPKSTLERYGEISNIKLRVNIKTPNSSGIPRVIRMLFFMKSLPQQVSL
jgi:hypothetical protein